MDKHKFVFTYKDIAEASGNTFSTVYSASSKKTYNPNDLKSISNYINYKTLEELKEMKRLTRFWKSRAESYEKEEIGKDNIEDRKETIR